MNLTDRRGKRSSTCFLTVERLHFAAGTVCSAAGEKVKNTPEKNSARQQVQVSHDGRVQRPRKKLLFRRLVLAQPVSLRVSVLVTLD